MMLWAIILYVWMDWLDLTLTTKRTDGQDITYNSPKTRKEAEAERSNIRCCYFDRGLLKWNNFFCWFMFCFYHSSFSIFFILTVFILPVFFHIYLFPYYTTMMLRPGEQQKQFGKGLTWLQTKLISLNLTFIIHFFLCTFSLYFKRPLVHGWWIWWLAGLYI